MAIATSRIELAKLTVLAAAIGLALASEGLATDATEIADGQPWKMQSNGGPNGQMVLNADGSGQMRAMGLRMRLQWQAEGDRLCVATRMRGTRCVTLVAAENGYAGLEDGEVAFLLTR
ncbi:MAG: hypothetical protein QNJ13_16440 [Paracoccaceae bacterium]|nr:hypothetical protein [Paracoccaceae bacterium]